MPRFLVAAASVAALAAVLAAPAPALAMRVVQDPMTGELRPPNAVEAAAFERAEAAMRAARAQQATPGSKTAPIPVGGQEIRYADGTIELKLGEDTHLYSVASVDASGNLSMDCLPAEQAKKYVKAGGRKPMAKPLSLTKTKVAQ